jgi:CheY-like chemotaxis protein
MNEQAAKLFAGQLFAGHMGVCAVLVNVLIDKGIVSRSELCDRFQQARLAASRCSAGPEVAAALAEMVDYVQHPAKAQSRAVAERDPLDGQTILLVEEQPIIVRHLQKALEAAGAEVHVAKNAADALPHLEQFDFSAAVLDWHPDGREDRKLARRLQEEGVRILFCATHPPEDATTRRGAPIFPKRPKEIVKALALLIDADASA